MVFNSFINHVNLSVYKSIISFCLILLLLVSNNLNAEDRVLESINVTEEQGYSVIDIRLNQQLTVTTYTPLEGGELLNIRVKRATSALQITEEPAEFETLSWKPTSKVPLHLVTLNLLDRSLQLEFKHAVKYKVRGGNNTFHILVDVFHSSEEPKIQDMPVAIPLENEIKPHAVKGAKNPKLAQIMTDARTAMLAKDYSRAVQLYTKVILDHPKSIYAQEALEYLGLARERKNQLAHAKVAYRKYLKLYPEGEDADRVKQRLAGILTARAEPKGKLRKGRKKRESESDLEWTTYGSVSQFYNRDVSKINNESRINRSSLIDNLDITSRLRTEDYQLTGRFSGAYEDDLENGEQDEHRISSFYLDFLHKPLGSSFRIGRQSRSTGGVLGRFDGVLLSFPAMENVQLNLVAGYNVESSTDVFINNDTYFYGISADIGTFFNSLDFNAFFIEQVHEGITDRRGVGGEIRYFESNRSFFTFLDYDVYHNDLNTFLFTGQYVFPDRTAVTATYDERKSPILTSRSALAGFQGVDSILDLLDFFNEDEIRDLVRDRTPTTRSFSLGISRPLTERFQINADFRWINTGGTKASEGLPTEIVQTGVIDAIEEGGDDYSYSTDLTANSLLTSGDLYTIGVRYIDSRANTTTFTLNTRYPITRELRINPRFRFDLRDNEDGTTRWSYRPSVRLTYRVLRALQLEVEGGGEWQKQERLRSQRTIADSDEFDRTKGYFVIAGYRIDF